MGELESPPRAGTPSPALLPFSQLKSRTRSPLSSFPLRDKSLALMFARPLAKLGHNRESENDKICLMRAMLSTLTGLFKRNRDLLPAALLLAAASLVLIGCGSKAAGHGRREQAAQAAGPAPPTPDTTAIETLRTPAGLVLKLAETPAAVTPSPSPAAQPG